eukprot:ANDGO_00670.mRNA.1 hypothetical protein
MDISNIGDDGVMRLLPEFGAADSWRKSFAEDLKLQIATLNDELQKIPDCLSLSVDIGNGREDKLVVKRVEDIRASVVRFVLRNDLDSMYINPLIQHVCRFLRMDPAPFLSVHSVAQDTVDDSTNLSKLRDAFIFYNYVFSKTVAVETVA